MLPGVTPGQIFRKNSHTASRSGVAVSNRRVEMNRMHPKAEDRGGCIADSPAVGVAKIAAFSILHRRGRENRRILRADRVVRPYKGYEKPRASGEKAPRFPFRTVGVDAYIDPPKAPILWWFSGETVLISHPTPLGRTTLSARRNCAFLRKTDAKSQYFDGPMWASAPTNDHEKSTNFEGGQSRPPLQVTVKNNDSMSSAPLQGV